MAPKDREELEMTAVVALSLVPTGLLLFVLAWQVAQIRRHRAEHAERMAALKTGQTLRRHLRDLKPTKDQNAA